MAQQKFTLTFDAQLNVSQMKGALSELQGSLNKLNIPDSMGKGIQNTMSQLQKEILNFETKASKQITNKSDFTNIEKSAEKIVELYNKLKIQVKDVTGMSGKDLEKLFPASVTQNINTATKALSNYKNELKKAEQNVNFAQQAVNKLNQQIAQESGKKILTTDQFKDLKNQVKDAGNDIAELVQKLEGLKTSQQEMEGRLNQPNKSSRYRELIKQIQDTEAEIDQAKIKFQDLNNQLSNSTTTQAQEKALEEYNTKLTEATQKLNEFKNTMNELQSTSEGGGLREVLNLFEKLLGADFSSVTNQEQAIEALGNALQNYLNQNLQEAINNLNNTQGKLDNFGNEAQNTQGKVKGLGDSVNQLDQRFNDVSALKSRIQYFFGLNNAIQLVRRALRNAFNTIKELDQAMTATAVVTNFSVGDMWSQLPEYTKRANELGVSTLEAYKAATLYYQQGLKTNQVTAISNETLKMARIAGLDAAEATDRMTNALRGFNMEINEDSAQRVNDVYSRLAAITASDTDEISTAMTKVASLAHNANMEFETTAAFLAQIIETTRESAETAGTALKTVVARFSEVKKLIDENQLTGTDEEGEIIDVNKVGQALRTAGIDLNKYFLGEVGLDDIFIELASKWDTLSTMQQRYIATQAAGSRQQSRFIALMSDYARTQELVGEAYTANGAAATQFAKTQESLESKLARLKNAWNEFTMGIMNSELVKGGVDLLTNLLNFVNNLTDGFGTLNGKVGDVISSIAKLGVLLGTLKVGKMIFTSAGGNLLGQLLSKAGIGAATGAAGAGAAGASSLAALGPTLLYVAAAIGAVVAAIAIFNKVTGRTALKHFQNYSDSLKQVAADTESFNNSLKTTQEKYKEYTNAIQNASNLDERSALIEDRNNYIESLIEQDERYKEYLVKELDSSTNQIVLSLNTEIIDQQIEKLSETEIKLKVIADFSESMVASAGVDSLQQRRFQYETWMPLLTGFSPRLWGNYEEKLDDYDFQIEKAYEKIADGIEKGIPDLLSSKYSEQLSNSQASVLNKLLTSQYNSRTYIEDLQDQISDRSYDLKDQFSKDSLKIIADEYGLTYDKKVSKDTLAGMIASYEVLGSIVDNISNKVDELIPELPKYENIFSAASAVDFDNLNFSNIDGWADLSDAVEVTENDLLNFAKQVSETDREAESYAHELKKTIQEQAKINSQLQTANKAKIYDKLAKSGIKANQSLQDYIQSLTAGQTKDVFNLVSNASDVISPDALSNLINEESLSSLLGTEQFDEIQNFFNSFSLDNPITAFLKLKDAEEQAANDSVFKGLLENIEETNSALFDSQNLLKSFELSEEYDQLTESLDKFIEENGKISSENIEDLAKESEILAALLKKDEINAKGLAKALTLVKKGEAVFDGLTDVVLKSLSSMTDFESMLEEIEDTIANFDPGRDYGAGSDFLVEQSDNLLELLDNWEFGNEQTEGYYDLLFGEKAYDTFMSKWGTKGIEEYSEEAKAQVEKLKSWAENNSYGFMKALTGSELGITELSPGSFNWDIGESTTEDLIKRVQDAVSAGNYGIESLSRSSAEMLIQGFAAQSYNLRSALEANDYKDLLQKAVKNLKGKTTITKQEAAALGASYGKTAEEVYKDLEKYFKGKPLPVLISWYNEDGSKVTDEEAQDNLLKILGINKDTLDDDINQLFQDLQLGEKFGAAFRTTTKGVTYIDLDTLKEWFSAENIPEDQWNQLANFILQTLQAQIPNLELGSVISIPVGIDAEGNITYETYEITSDTAEAVEVGLEAAYKQADANPLVSTFKEATRDGVKEGILSAIEDLNGLEVHISVVTDNSTVPITASKEQVVTAEQLTKDFNNGKITYDQWVAGMKKLGLMGKGTDYVSQPEFALTGEEGPEIVWNKEQQYSYIVGQNGPEFVELQPGDRVYNAQQTDRILKRSSFAKGGTFGSYESGLGGYNLDKIMGTSNSGSAEDTTEPTKWRNELDWLYNLVEDIKELERTQTKLAEKHDRYLEDISKSGRDLYNITNQELQNLYTQRDNQQAMYNRRLQEMIEQISYSKYSDYVWYSYRDQTVTIDWEAIERLQDKDAYDEIVELISKAEQIQSQLDDAEDALWDIEGKIKELQNRYLSQFVDFQKRVYDAVVSKYENQIEELSNLNDSLNDSNAAILNSLQEQINLQRQIRDNTDTENNIRDMEARLAYLRRDTTGTNEGEIRKLEDQLEQAREGYSDKLIDQSLNRLQESNEKAAEQREQQIELMTAQLKYWEENGMLWNEVNQLIESSISSMGSLISGSSLELLLKEEEGWKAMSEQQREVWANELILAANQAGAYLIQIAEGLTTLSEGIWAFLPNSSYTSEKYQYATGGLVTKTGSAWLDGTPREPEYVLNARQTDAFLRLAEVLPNVFKEGTTTTNTLSNNIYVDLNVNVDGISSDYDVDRMVDRVKDDISKISSYRNVNSVSFLR